MLLATSALPAWLERSRVRRASDSAARNSRESPSSLRGTFTIPDRTDVSDERARRSSARPTRSASTARAKAARDDIGLPNSSPCPGAADVVHLTSRDVVHSFTLNEMRVRQDAIPGLLVRTWFTPTKTGNWEIGCSQFCGLGHYRMRGAFTVVSEREWAAWQEREVALHDRRRSHRKGGASRRRRPPAECRTRAESGRFARRPSGAAGPPRSWPSGAAGHPQSGLPAQLALRRSRSSANRLHQIGYGERSPFPMADVRAHALPTTTRSRGGIWSLRLRLALAVALSVGLTGLGALWLALNVLGVDVAAAAGVRQRVLWKCSRSPPSPWPQLVLMDLVAWQLVHRPDPAAAANDRTCHRGRFLRPGRRPCAMTRSATSPKVSTRCSRSSKP